MTWYGRIGMVADRSVYGPKFPPKGWTPLTIAIHHPDCIEEYTRAGLRPAEGNSRFPLPEGLARERVWPTIRGPRCCNSGAGGCAGGCACPPARIINDPLETLIPVFVKGGIGWKNPLGVFLEDGHTVPFATRLYSYGHLPVSDPPDSMALFITADGATVGPPEKIKIESDVPQWVTITNVCLRDPAGIRDILRIPGT